MSNTEIKIEKLEKKVDLLIKSVNALTKEVNNLAGDQRATNDILLMITNILDECKSLSN